MRDNSCIARRFVDARRAAQGLRQYPGEFPDSLDGAYAVQAEAIARWNEAVAGWKVGRIQPPYSERFKMERLAGPIFKVEQADSFNRAPSMSIFSEGFAAAEGEFLLRLRKTPPKGKFSYTSAEAAELIEAVHVGIEIASSPLGAINALGPIAIISDFGNNNGLVVGEEIPDWLTSGFANWQVTTSIDDQIVGSGSASAFPNGPLGSAAFLFSLAARHGMRLEQGQWISSGAITGVHDVMAGQNVEVRFGDKYSVQCTLTPQLPG